MPITKKHKEVLSLILQQIKPSKEDITSLNILQKQIINKIKVPQAKTQLGGSGAKNTWLKNTHDIDIYVKFPAKKFSKKSQDLSQILYKSLKKSFSKISKIHGSRDYFQVNHKGYTVEVVPILEISNPKQAKNITDFSAFHVKYVKSKKGLENQIRLLKTFAKANRFYGAESHIKGLSGYACELLTIKYKSFLNFIKAASKYKSTEIIGNKKTAEKLNWAKKISPLIIVDPVQPDRNASAAISKSQFQNIIKASKIFLRSPKKEHFEKQPIDIEKLKKSGFLTIIQAQPTKSKRDVAGARALKAFTYLKKKIKHYQIKESIFDYENTTATFYLVTKKKKLPDTFKHNGPPLDHKQAIQAFKKANKSFTIKKDKTRYYTIKPTPHPLLHDKLKYLLQQPEVTERIKNIILLE
jgi:tRNA nucleotidyltransferase (CCA-adding enzyme)